MEEFYCLLTFVYLCVSRAVAELLLHGNFQTLDLSNFSFERLITQKPYLETGIV